MVALSFPLLSLLLCFSLVTSDPTQCIGADAGDCVVAATYECHYVNGTQEVVFLERYFYNQEEFVYFDSREGKFIAKTEFGRPDADYWNSNPDLIADRKSAVERFCIHNYDWLDAVGVKERRVEPSIRISLVSQYERPDKKQHMLKCDVFGFYPYEIEVKWYRNGQEETKQVQFTEPYPNGDWTYQILVMLETEIEKGDTFTCEVHHSSLKTPHRVDWNPHLSDAAKNKMATGIVGFVLGIVFFIVGLVIYMRGRKVQTPFHGHQTERFLSQ